MSESRRPEGDLARKTPNRREEWLIIIHHVVDYQPALERVGHPEPGPWTTKRFATDATKYSGWMTSADCVTTAIAMLNGMGFFTYLRLAYWRALVATAGATWCRSATALERQSQGLQSASRAFLWKRLWWTPADVS